MPTRCCRSCRCWRTTRCCLHVLDDAAPCTTAEPSVRIGQRERERRRFRASPWWPAATGSGDAAGVVAVIGPTRMDYSKVIQAVRCGERGARRTYRREARLRRTSAGQREGRKATQAHGQGSVRGARRLEERDGRRDQEGVPPPRARAASGREQGARRRGPVQGAQRGVRRPVRPAEAQRVRPVRHHSRCGGRRQPLRRRRLRGLRGPVRRRLRHGRHLQLVLRRRRPARTRPAAPRRPRHGRGPAPHAGRGCRQASKKEIVYDRLAPCPDCGGTGLGEGGSEVTCPDCGGKGRVVTVQRTFLGDMQTAMPCKTLRRHRARPSRTPAPNAKARAACPTASA